MDFHGYNDIRNSRNSYQKGFWLLLTIAAICVTVAISALTLRRFFNNPTSVSMTKVALSSMDLPEVQICTYQTLNVSKMISAGFCNESIRFIYQYLAMYFSIHYKTTYMLDRLAESMNNSLIFEEKLAKEMNTTNVNFEELFLNFGLDCSEVLHECSIGWSMFDCCRYARAIVHPNFGKCFILQNLSSVSKQSWAGPTAGLLMLITPQPPSAGKVDQPLNGNSAIGANIDVDNKYRTASISYTGILMEKANYLSMALTKYTKSTLDDCSTISTRECMPFCYGKIFQRLSNCTQMGFWKFPGTPICLPHQIYSAVENFNVMQQAYEECTATLCKKPVCNEFCYFPSISYSDVDLNLVRALNGIDNSTEGIAQIYLFYGMMGYLNLDEFQTLTFDGVLSAIGGNMGLYLGASMITVFQAILVCFGCTKRHWLERNQRKNAVNSCVSPAFVCPITGHITNCPTGDHDKDQKFSRSYFTPYPK